jgi:molybdopterin molybdotransferase
MICIEEAKRIILERTRLLAAEEVPLLQAVGRVITEDVHAPRDIPSASNSAMDGYAFSSGSLTGNRLKVSGFLPAGEIASGPTAAGEAVRIMTGAPVPPGCDTVVPIEDVVVSGDFIEVTGKVKAGNHIRLQGEELRSGDLAIQAASLLRPQEIGILASFGQTTVPVYRRPSVAILATGDELLEPGCSFQNGKLYNSNSYSIACQTLEAGALPVMLGIAADQQSSTREKILAGIENDILITSGGVSTGDRDYVKETITELGGEILFWKVHMKPGKPFAFGILNGKPIFALPGNPVAAMVSFEMFVRPAILKQQGLRGIHRPQVQAVLTEPLKNKGDRPHLVSVHVKLKHGFYTIDATGDQGSARISALIAGNGLVKLEPGASLAVGDTATVMLLSREFEMGAA